MIEKTTPGARRMPSSAHLRLKRVVRSPLPYDPCQTTLLCFVFQFTANVMVLNYLSEYQCFKYLYSYSILSNSFLELTYKSC